jgi:hypothetical protein
MTGAVIGVRRAKGPGCYRLADWFLDHGSLSPEVGRKR